MSKDDPDRFDRAIMAWHASPHDFDEFGPMRKVSGTGQGVAVYGRGAAYVAENPRVSGPGESEYMKEFADHPELRGEQRWQVKGLGGWEDLTTDGYDEAALPGALNQAKSPAHFGQSWVLSYLSNNDQMDNPGALDLLRSLMRSGNRRSDRKGRELQDLEHFMNQRLGWIPWDSTDAKYTEYEESHARAVAEYLEKHADQELRHVKGDEKPGPFSYRVAVHLKPETMLDWDETFDNHHPDAQEKIARAFGHAVHALGPEHDETKKAYHQSVMSNAKYTNLKGRNIYEALTNDLKGDYEASEALFNAGIHGIRYKDQGSRNTAPSLHVDGEDILDSSGHHMTPEDRGLAMQLASRVRNDWRLHGLSTNGLRQYLKQEMDLAQEFVNINKQEAAKLGMNYDQASHRYSKFSDAEETLRVAKHDHEWFEQNADRLKLVYPKPTYNYVIFHPDFVEALAQYNIKGEKIRDIGPGVHLRSVDHDPFKGEDK